MKQDTGSTKVITPATMPNGRSGRHSGTNKDGSGMNKKSSGIGNIGSGRGSGTKKALEVLWSIMGLKMALTRMTDFGIAIDATTSPDGVATITCNFTGIDVDLIKGTVNGKDLDATIASLTEAHKNNTQKKAGNK